MPPPLTTRVEGRGEGRRYIEALSTIARLSEQYPTLLMNKNHYGHSIDKVGLLRHLDQSIFVLTAIRHDRKVEIV